MLLRALLNNGKLKAVVKRNIIILSIVGINRVDLGRTYYYSFMACTESNGPQKGPIYDFST